MRTSLKVSLFAAVAIALIMFISTVSTGTTPKLGLDLAGGLQANFVPERPISSSQYAGVINVMQTRVDLLGATGAQVNQQGNEIAIQVPGVKDASALIQKIGQTGQLFFRPALCLVPPYTPPAKGHPLVTTLPPATCPSTNLLNSTNLGTSGQSGQQVQATQTPPADTALATYPTTCTSEGLGGPKVPAGDKPCPGGYDDSSAENRSVILPGTNSGYTDRILFGPAQVYGRQITSALASLNGSAWVVNLSLNGPGSSAWDKLSTTQYHAYVGFDLDGGLISMPISDQAGGYGGKVQISGNFTEQSAKNLAQELNYGALPVGLKPINVQTVSPTLGKSDLKAGLIAGIGGLLAVLIYTIFYYRALGIVVVSGLALTAALLWSIVGILGHTIDLTLDLSGVTGVIVSIGITVDSYIVYFERLKDEARAGRTVRSSVERAFQGAFRTVVNADFVTIIAALVLYLLSVGSVRGFALFLLISTALDLFTTWFFTRPLVIWLGRSKTVTEARFIGIARGLAVQGGAA